MAIIKCKMCGGDLVLLEGMSVAECEYCGSRQTVPLADNEKKLMLFARAGRLRAACEFDKAAGIYEAIVAEFPQEAEAYWGLVLCKYGIEYVDDPATGKKIPTCHRSSFDSVMDDGNFDQAMENADEVALGIYRQEAKQIERIRRGILEVSSSEKPYDIFICYKETDSNGDRTVDSLLAQDIYDALTSRGYRVFFSRITLEDKLGQAYEPYIFAALNSAKIMLVVGTCYEHYNAVWVKNEWSRYLKIMAQDKGRYLIPCYKNIDVYDIPKEFAHLQGQDMGKVGAISDLLRGIEKLMPPITQKSPAASNKITALLERGNMALEDSDWSEADRFFEDVLNTDPKNAGGYLGKLLAEFRIAKAEDLGTVAADFTASSNYQKALRFGDASVHDTLDHACKEKLYSAAKILLQKGDYQNAAAQFAAISGWRDADTLTEECRLQIAEIETRKTAERKKKPKQDTKKKQKASVAAASALLVIAGLLLWKPQIQPTIQARKEAALLEEQRVAAMALQEEQYSIALSLMEEGRYEEAMDAFAALAGYKDSDERYETCRIAMADALCAEQYQQACALADNGEYGKAAITFAKLDGYKDARERSFAMWKHVPGRKMVSWWETNWIYVLHAVREDGTIAVDTNKAERFSEEDLDAYYTADYQNIVSIHGLVGLKYDGTLALPNPDKLYQLDCNGREDEQRYLEKLYQNCVERHREVLSEWTDIIALSVCVKNDEYSIFVGLKSDGTVVSAGTSDYIAEELKRWRDMIAVSASDTHVVGLKSDGTVVAVGNNEDGQCEVSDWTDIKAVLAADETTGAYDGSISHHGMTFGVKKDGTVIAVGSNHTGAVRKAANWNNIKSLVFGPWTGGPCGIREDGTVVSAMGGQNGSPENLHWRKICDAATTGTYAVGVTIEGTLLFYGFEDPQFTRARAWTDIQTQ